MDEVYSDLKSAMDNLMSDLPDGCEDPMIMELSADFMPTMILSAIAPEGTDVAGYLNDTVVPAIESIGGVAQVEVTGSQDEYLRIVLDEAALQQYGLSISTVGSAIAAADFDMPVGDVTMGTQDIACLLYTSCGVLGGIRQRLCGDGGGSGRAVPSHLVAKGRGEIPDRRVSTIVGEDRHSCLLYTSCCRPSLRSCPNRCWWR